MILFFVHVIIRFETVLEALSLGMFVRNQWQPVWNHATKLTNQYVSEIRSILSTTMSSVPNLKNQSLGKSHQVRYPTITCHFEMFARNVFLTDSNHATKFILHEIHIQMGSLIWFRFLSFMYLRVLYERKWFIYFHSMLTLATNCISPLI